MSELLTKSRNQFLKARVFPSLVNCSFTLRRLRSRRRTLEYYKGVKIICQTEFKCKLTTRHRVTSSASRGPSVTRRHADSPPFRAHYDKLWQITILWYYGKVHILDLYGKWAGRRFATFNAYHAWNVSREIANLYDCLLFYFCAYYFGT